ncbi:MAG: hypothetical protein ABF709_05035 [Leuconostoc pseudomesenteroides]|uniref:hypothetical protein n=1 Tax=Leuconostoc pseudomesenteroides TaxID=33968 RepID=UPI001E4EC1B5|nr:hypothetical protein [Leuconostoc pseudomesenteroides]MCC7668917.1 hypothetical protein [Leuconostoc pseudomesenteroides]
MSDEKIKQFISDMSYWQKINLMIAHYMITTKQSREACYEDALNSVSKDENVEYALQSMLNIGPIIDGRGKL